jgi:hypothetical protein
MSAVTYLIRFIVTFKFKFGTQNLQVISLPKLF